VLVFDSLKIIMHWLVRIELQGCFCVTMTDVFLTGGCAGLTGHISDTVSSPTTENTLRRQRHKHFFVKVKYLNISNM